MADLRRAIHWLLIGALHRIKNLQTQTLKLPLFGLQRRTPSGYKQKHDVMHFSGNHATQPPKRTLPTWASLSLGQLAVQVDYGKRVVFKLQRFALGLLTTTNVWVKDKRTNKFIHKSFNIRGKFMGTAKTSSSAHVWLRYSFSSSIRVIAQKAPTWARKFATTKFWQLRRIFQCSAFSTVHELHFLISTV